jgi:mono/diheme cytochrome c family protein
MTMVTRRERERQPSRRGRRPRSWIFAAVLVAGAAGAASAAGAKSAGLRPAARAVAGNPTTGKRIFSTAGCKGCHTLAAAHATAVVGPDLDKLAPSYATVVHQVTNGGAYMPAFGGKLSKAEIQDVAAFVYESTHAAASKTTIVTVLAGKPSELAFKLSRKTVPLGKVVFVVENKGKLTHTFEVCSSPKGGTKNACAGKKTPQIRPGKTARLTIVFTKKGTYEYLCTMPGHAAGGMKGDLKVT